MHKTVNLVLCKTENERFSKKVVDKFLEWVYSCLASKARGQNKKEKNF